DASGLVQLVLNPEEDPNHKVAHDLRTEWVIAIEGRVRRRDADTINPNLATGEVEVFPTSVTVLNQAKTPPFPLNETKDVDETLRLRYRYLDLRRAEVAR